MKTPKPSKISPQTRTAIAAILDADANLSPAHRLAILDACDNATAAPTGAEMTAKEASRILGKSLPTVLRWIDAGKLDGRKVGQRLTMVSTASVESIRAAIAAPLPDRLEHHAATVKPSKKRRKANRC